MRFEVWSESMMKSRRRDERDVFSLVRDRKTGSDKLFVVVHVFEVCHAPQPFRSIHFASFFVHGTCRMVCVVPRSINAWTMDPVCAHHCPWQPTILQRSKRVSGPAERAHPTCPVLPVSCMVLSTRTLSLSLDSQLYLSLSLSLVSRACPHSFQFI